MERHEAADGTERLSSDESSPKGCPSRRSGKSSPRRQRARRNKNCGACRDTKKKGREKMSWHVVAPKMDSKELRDMS